MTTSSKDSSLEEQIARWREYLHRRRGIQGPDVEALEGHLRDQVALLTKAGLAEDEAFLIAGKRLAAHSTLWREFASEDSERLWKQLVVTSAVGDESGTAGRTETFVVLPGVNYPETSASTILSGAVGR